ncbi:MAG: inositol monophosphatase [Halanaeroarchaeum sp.]
MSDETRLAVAERAARAGAEVAETHFRTDLDVETKSGKTDVVTRADREAQERVIEVVTEAYPDDPVVGEEGEEREDVPESGPAWIVDPIDGTANYVRGSRTWGTVVAAVIDEEPVAAVAVFPALGDVYVADEHAVRLNGERIRVSERTDPAGFAVVPTTWWPPDRRDEYAAAFEGILDRFGDARRFGSAQASLAMVAGGHLEGVLSNRRARPWDTVAGVAMIRRAGGTVTNLAGERWRWDDAGLVASNGTAHDDLIEAARHAERARTDR